jgi:DNA-binding NtrC family response regulator
MLSELGYRVVEMAGAREALAWLRRRRADYVVTDHLMPGMSGTDLAREIAALHPGLPTLIVSGYADIDGISADLPRLTKPFRQAELAACMAALSA